MKIFYDAVQMGCLFGVEAPRISKTYATKKRFIKRYIKMSENETNEGAAPERKNEKLEKIQQRVVESSIYKAIRKAKIFLFGDPVINQLNKVRDQLPVRSTEPWCQCLGLKPKVGVGDL